MSVDMPPGFFIRICKACWSYIMGWFFLPKTINEIKNKIEPQGKVLKNRCPNCQIPMSFQRSTNALETDVYGNRIYDQIIADEFLLYYKCENSACGFKQEVEIEYKPNK